MNLKNRIEAFAALGVILNEVLSGRKNKFSNKINTLISSQHIANPWFTSENVRMALTAIGGELTIGNLELWTSKYPELNNNRNPIRVGIIMAGNIPLAGFHDFLSVLISGNKLVAKTSSKDSDLVVLLGEILCSAEPRFSESIEFTDGFLSNFDAVIATGSDNSSRYFEYYFGKYPHIIRKNRNSVAIIEGNESEADIINLGLDVFSYFGLGCRNVSKVFVPTGYDFRKMIEPWNKYADVANHSKYANNYDFNKAVYLINKEKFLETGFILLREDSSFSSPVSVLYYEQYKSLDNVDNQLKIHSEKIQCIIGKKDIPFGKGQFPKLWDYSDNIDTLDFLLKKNIAGIL